jgi:hypothetical protein
LFIYFISKYFILYFKTTNFINFNKTIKTKHIKKKRKALYFAEEYPAKADLGAIDQYNSIEEDPLVNNCFCFFVIIFRLKIDSNFKIKLDGCTKTRQHRH